MKYLVLFFLSSWAIAGIEQAPPAFKYKNDKAVFVDFIKAHYSLEYKPRVKKASSHSVIDFEMYETGYPIFDLVNKPIAVAINGETVKQKLIRVPGKASKVRIALKELPPGKHRLEIIAEIKNGTRFKNKRRRWSNVSSGFFIRDLTDRMFLEQYLPSNYEYDQYKMEMDVKVVGTKRWHSLFVNGQKTKLTNNHYKVSFPEWYTASSVFFHLVPINRFVRWYLKYPSINGKEIPVTIYSQFRFYNHYVKKKAWRVMKELEADYGPYPHDSLIIYGTGLRGGMEHSGATETSIVSLGHELQHMYFAKAIHPANGNSGWLDEAIASWRDHGHKTLKKPFYESVNLGNRNIYARNTSKKSYEYGRSFMGHINYLLKEIGKPGLKDFLRIFFEKRKFTTITTEDFKADLEEYAQISFGEQFHQYIYGNKDTPFAEVDRTPAAENPHHPHISQEEFESRI